MALATPRRLSGGRPSPHGPQRHWPVPALDHGEELQALGQSRRAELRRDFVAQLVEDRLRPSQGVIAASGEALALRAGDTLRFAPDTPRRISADTDARAVVASPAGPIVTTAEGGSRALPWAT